jgi:ankyrin repeat protein/uncharacterized protein YjbI with pentapeptide repeats
MENLATQLSELFSAVRRSDIQQVKRLIAANVSPNQCDAQGQTALMLAAQIGQPEIIQLLCAAAANRPASASLSFDVGLPIVAEPSHSATNALGGLNLLCDPVFNPTAESGAPLPSLYSAGLDSVNMIVPNVDKRALEAPQSLPPVAEMPALPPALSPALPTGQKADSASGSPVFFLDEANPALSGDDAFEADLSETELSEVDLSETELSETELSETELSETELSETELSETELSEADDVNDEVADQYEFLEGAEQTQKSPKEMPELLNNRLDNQLSREFENVLNRDRNYAYALDTDLDSELDRDFDPAFTADFDFDSDDFGDGNFESGDYESGNFESGDFESGNYESGDYQSGDFESGSYESGDYVSGDFESELDRDLDGESGDESADLPPLDESMFSSAAQQPDILAPIADPFRKPPNKSAEDLKEAVRCNDVSAVRALLNAGASVRSANWYDTPVLVIAAELGHADIVQALIESGANVNTGYDRLPLNTAAAHGHLEVVQILLDAGAFLHDAEESGHTALMTAAQRGHLPVVQALVARGAKINAVSRGGDTAFKLASKNGHQSVCDFFADCKSAQGGLLAAHVLSAEYVPLPQSLMSALPGSEGLARPALAAAPEPSPEQVSEAMPAPELAELQAVGPVLETEAVPEEALEDTPAFTLAALSDLESNHFHDTEAHTDEVHGVEDDLEQGLRQFIAQSVDTAAVDDETLQEEQAVTFQNRQEALMTAAKAGYLPGLTQAVRAGAAVNEVGQERRTALSFAVAAGHIEAVAWLLALGADPNGFDETDEGLPHSYPLMVATTAEANRSEVIGLLVRQGAYVDQTDAFGRTALMLAAQRLDMEAMTTLVSVGSDLNLRDRQGLTALMQAKRQQSAGSSTQPILYLRQAARQHQQAIVLLQAVTRDDLSSVQHLLASGLSPSAQASGITPLCQAAAKGHDAIAQQLIAAGANVNQISGKDSIPPIFYAAYQGYLSIVELLINEGADITFCTPDVPLNLLEYAELGQEHQPDAGKAYEQIIALLRGQGLSHREAYGIEEVMPTVEKVYAA